MEEIKTLAKSILSDDIGIVEVSRKIVKLQYELGLEKDDDFSIFWIIDSETDHLPINEQRQNYSKEKLNEIDEEIENCKEYYKDYIFSACENIIKNK